MPGKTQRHQVESDTIDSLAILRGQLADDFNGSFITRYGTVPGDGLGASWDWDGASVAADDGVNVIRPTAIGAATAGRFIKRIINGPTPVYQITKNAGATIALRDLVTFNSSGDVIKAIATAHHLAAVGYAVTAAAPGSQVVVNMLGVISGFTGLTPGSRYFLSHSTAGGIHLAATLSTAAGHIIQPVGTAISATELAFNPASNPTIAA